MKLNPLRSPGCRRSGLLLAAALLAAGCQPARDDRPLTDFACSVTVSDPPASLRAGGPAISVKAQIMNRGTQAWPAWRGDGVRKRTVKIGSRWEPARVDAGPLAPLFEDLAPGETVVVSLDVIPPDDPGVFLLRIEPVQEQVGWFGDRNSDCVAGYSVSVVP